MIIKNAKFVTSAAKIEQCLDYGIPEIAVAGKSNVGKSSFINYMANNKSLAKTSSTPGRTRLVNYFSFNNNTLMLVDLPGYGYAKKGGEDKDNWNNLIGSYLTTSKRLATVVVLVDIRHEPSPLDRYMVDFLSNYRIPFMIVATKADKLSKAQIGVQKAVIAKSFALVPTDIFVCSALKKTGLDKVLEKIDFFIEHHEVKE